MPRPRIAIIGAGPAGCMLARLLHLSNIEATVFDGEESPNYRSQGGTLDLHTADGLAAMKAAGLYDEFLKHARWDGEFLAITDKNLKVYFSLEPTTGDNQGKGKLGGQRPEIDRADLRRILIESLPAGMIKWGHHLNRVEADGTLVFAQTTLSGFDLIVGADGAWSKVRNLLSDQKPTFVGISNHDLSIADAARTAPEVYKAVNRGSIFAFADGRKLSVQQMGDGSINIYANTLVKGEDWMKTCGYDPFNSAEVRAYLLQDGGPFSDYHPTLKEAIAKADAKCFPRTLYQLPVGFRWEHRRGATLIGDAAHLMTPFAGEGVNVALEDARKLAQFISRAVSGMGESGDMTHVLDKAVADFEKEMWPRSQRVARLTDELTQAWMFTPNTPKSVIAKTTMSHVRYHTPAIVHPFASAAIHSYYFVKNLLD